MPTARELLEQADALMRRNRAAGGAANEPAKPGGLPLATPSMSPALVSPRTIQHEPIAPSIARTSLPVDPSESPFVVSQPAAAKDAAPRSDDSVPVLTEAVGEAEAAADLDDVPVLTDVVEEIEMTVAGPIDDDEPDVEEAAHGEPSVWFEPDAGDASLLGPAPDSVAVVPAVGQVPLAPPPGRDPLGFDQPPPGFEPAQRGEEPEPPFADEPAPVEAPATADAAAEATFDVEPAPADELADAVHAGAPQAEPVAPAALPSSPAADEARVRAIAEEIGMQVLQRIDIFTDTTLRERLGERLKPVVERVSAELVDALNQHVGELLRAHVAEAIEREIETWHNRGDGSPR